MTYFKIRKARPYELQLLVSIDNEASQLYADAGLDMDLPETHPFVIDEIQRWASLLNKEWIYVATDNGDNPVGFCALAFLDNHPYLDQLSVLPRYMRQGIGTKLLKQAANWSAPHPLWLTTYSHLPWNQSFYQKYGFEPVAEQSCGPELLELLRVQRQALPEPENRIAMRYRSSEAFG